MSTVNISLPAEQINIIDNLVTKYGFANRSEFFRSLLRFINYQPQLLSRAANFPFISPQEKSISKIMNSFIKTKKYSSAFLKDLKDGLKNSDYFIK